MVHYKLTFFNGRGAAETIRMIFAVAEVEYEDVRVERDKWPAMKSSTPFGQIPILEIDGKTFCQSNAIGRYLARKFNLAGKTDLDQLQADLIIDCIEDVVKPFLSSLWEKDEARKLTWADLAFHVFISWGKVGGNEAVLDKYPKLKALVKRVESVPKVAVWIAKRPVTEF